MQIVVEYSGADQQQRQCCDRDPNEDALWGAQLGWRRARNCHRLDWSLDGSYESISPPGLRLDKSWIIRGVSQGLAQLRHGCIQATIEIDEGIRGKRVTETMWIGDFDAGSLAMMAKQGADPRGGHAGATSRALQRNEQSISGLSGPLQPQIMIEQLSCFRSQRKEARLTTLAVHANLGFRQQQIVAIQIQDLLGAKSLQ